MCLCYNLASNIYDKLIKKSKDCYTSIESMSVSPRTLLFSVEAKVLQEK